MSVAPSPWAIASDTHCNRNVILAFFQGFYINPTGFSFTAAFMRQPLQHHFLPMQLSSAQAFFPPIDMLAPSFRARPISLSRRSAWTVSTFRLPTTYPVQTSSSQTILLDTEMDE